MKGLWKFLHWAVFRLRIYVVWSWLYNQFRNRGYRKAWDNWLRHCDVKLEAGEFSRRAWKYHTLRHLSLPEIQASLDTIEWKKDSWRAFWDAIAWPERMLFWISCKQFPPKNSTDPRYDLWNKKGCVQPQTEMDCDDFASAALRMVDDMDQLLYPAIVVQGYFLNVARMQKNRSFWGHNVCLVERATVQKDGIKKEWTHIGNWGIRGPFPDRPRGAIEDLRGKDDLPLVGWAVLFPDYKLCERSGKLPDKSFFRFNSLTTKPKENVDV